jgi:hypothetical protein
MSRSEAVVVIGMYRGVSTRPKAGTAATMRGPSRIRSPRRASATPPGPPPSGACSRATEAGSCGSPVGTPQWAGSESPRDHEGGRRASQEPPGSELPRQDRQDRNDRDSHSHVAVWLGSSSGLGDADPSGEAGAPGSVAGASVAKTPTTTA